MADDFSVLVTAVGGNLGQAVIKALRMSSPECRVHGVDCDPTGVGKFFCDTFTVVPPAKDLDYLRVLDGVASRSGACALIPCSEAEIASLASADESLPLS